jgi:CRP/FNR family transcriptional regulator
MVSSTFLQQVSLFSHLSSKAIEKIAEVMQQQTYKKNSSIFHEGESASKLHIIFSGQVKVFKLSAEGKEHILHLLDTGSIVAEAPMFAGENYPANCSAITDCVILTITREQLISLIKNDPQIALNMLALQAKRLKEFANKIEELSLKNTEQKLIDYLLANQNPIDQTIKLKMNMNDLANYLGISRENLSRTFSKLIKEGVIKKSANRIILKYTSNHKYG